MHIRGDIDSQDAHRLEQFLLATIREPFDGNRTHKVIVDVADTTFLGSAGLHVLARTRDHAAAGKIAFCVSGASQLHTRMFDVVGLTPAVHLT